MSLTVSSVLADNRGQVYVNLATTSGIINRSTINKSSVLLYSAGADKKYGTSDDVRLAENIVFNTNVNRIIVTTKVGPASVTACAWLARASRPKLARSSMASSTARIPPVTATPAEISMG